MKRLRKNLLLVLCVALGVLCAYRGENVANASETELQNARLSGAWSWFDAQYGLDDSLSTTQAPWFTTAESAPSPTPVKRPSWFDALEADAVFQLTPSEDFVLTALNTPTSELKPISPAPESVDSTEIVYRGSALSNLAIEPYGKRVFIYGSGAWGNLESDDANPGFSARSWGGGVGQDWNLFGHGIVGYGLQGNDTRLNPGNGGTYKAAISTFAGYLHFSVFDALWRIDASLGMARNWQRQRRLSNDSLNFFTTSQKYFDIEFGARFDKGYTRIEPIVNMRVLNLNEPKKAEKYLSTTYKSEFSDASYRLRLGSRFSWEHETILATLKPYLRATWSHEFGNRQIYTLGDNTPFPVAMRYGRRQIARDRLNLGGGLDAAMRETLDLYIQYDVDFAQEYVGYSFSAGLNKKF